MRSRATASDQGYGCTGAIALRLAWRPRPWLVWVGIAGVATLPFAFHHEDYPGLVVGDAVLAVAAAGLVAGQVAIAAAAVSHHYLEVPVRSWARRRSDPQRGAKPLVELQEEYILESVRAVGPVVAAGAAAPHEQ